MLKLVRPSSTLVALLTGLSLSALAQQPPVLINPSISTTPSSPLLASPHASEGSSTNDQNTQSGSSNVSFQATPEEKKLAEQMDQQQTSLLLMKNQLALLQSQIALAKAQKDYDAMIPHKTSALYGDIGHWKTEWIVGFEGHREASLVTDNGVMRVHQGTELGDGWTVRSIRSDGVIVTRLLTHKEKKPIGRHRYEWVESSDVQDMLIPLVYLESPQQSLSQTDEKNKDQPVAQQSGVVHMLDNANQLPPPPTKVP